MSINERRRTINRDDPRVKRTIKLLGDTLMTLIVEKGYEAVTIQDITDRAEVSRTTFYLHFADKEELLFESVRAMYDDLMRAAHMLDFSDEAHLESALCDPADFEHVKRYLAFYKVMLSERGSMGFFLRVLDYLAEMMQQSIAGAGMPPRVPLPIVAHLAAGAEIAIMTWWVRNDMPYTPEAMAKFLYQAQMYGVWWALGIDVSPGEPEKTGGA